MAIPAGTGRRMGLDFGLETHVSERGINSAITDRVLPKVCKRKFRWLFKIPNICADKEASIATLPPSKGARPSVSFKEIEVKHLNEDIFYPSKPDWKPINLVLYDIKTIGQHPVFEWISRIYKNPGDSEYGFAVKNPDIKDASKQNFLIPQCFLSMYDGCGKVVENWVFEHCYPSSIDFGDLDMGVSDICTCNLTLRYARAWIEENFNQVIA